MIPRLGLAIFTSPKVASTSLKLLAFELENGRPYEPFIANGKTIYIHRFYPAKPFVAPDRRRFPVVVAFVRDPVERLKSAYRDRVVGRQDQTKAQWRRAVRRGLRRDPDFDRFVAKLDDYRRAIPDVAHHCAPQVDFLGRTLRTYDRVFDIAEMDRFESLVSDLAGRDVRVPREHRSQRTPLELSPSTLRTIRDRFADDYAAFEKVFAARSDPAELGRLGGPGGSLSCG